MTEQDPPIVDYAQPRHPDQPGDVPSAPPPVPQAPREVTDFVRRQSWRDPRVRFAWLMTIILGAIAVVLGVIGWQQWATDTRITRSGVPVEATIFEYPIHLGTTVISSTDATVSLNFELDGKKYKNIGKLPPRDTPYRNGDTLQILVDRNDPSLWTVQAKTPSLAREMIGPIVAFPSALIAWLVAYLLRRRVLSIWRHGQAESAIVLDAKQTAIAPRSWLIRCARMDRSIVAVYVPQRLGKFEQGQLIWLLAQAKTARTIPIMVYQETTMNQER